MSQHEVRSFYYRLATCLLMVFLGITTFFTATYPPSFQTHGQDFNKTINYLGRNPSRDNHNVTIAHICYLPVGLKDGDSKLFTTGVLAGISFPGAYIVLNLARAHDIGLFKLGDKPVIQKFWPESRNSGVIFMFLAAIALIVGASWSAIDEWSSSTIPKAWLEELANKNASENSVPVIGAQMEHGEYSFKEWICQWTPLLVGTRNTRISAPRAHDK